MLASLGRQLFPWMKTAREGWFSKTLARVRRGGRQAPPAAADGPSAGGAAEEAARMSTETTSAEASLAVPSYLDQAPEVSARFARIKQRPVILDVADLSKSFSARGRPPTVALDRVSFQVHRRELMCVIGPSGCGKSTLARLVAGLEARDGRARCCSTESRSTARAPIAGWCSRATRSSPG